MNKQDIYEELEKTFTSYAAMAAIPVEDSGEEIVSLKEHNFPFNLYDEELPPLNRR